VQPVAEVARRPEEAVEARDLGPRGGIMGGAQPADALLGRLGAAEPGLLLLLLRGRGGGSVPSRVGGEAAGAGEGLGRGLGLRLREARRVGDGLCGRHVAIAPLAQASIAPGWKNMSTERSWVVRWFR
jgi:hypothetical protein